MLIHKNDGQILTLIGIYCTLTGRFASGCDIQDSNLKHGLYKYPHNNLVGPEYHVGITDNLEYFHIEMVN